MRRALISVVALFAVALAHADGSVTGRYRLQSSNSRGASGDGLTLRVNGRFLLEKNGRVLHGDYRVEDGHLALRTEDGERLRGEIKDGRVTLEGQRFERVSLRDALSVRRFPTDAASGRLRSDETPTGDDRPDPQAGSFGAPLSKPAVVVPDLTSILPATTDPVPSRAPAEPFSPAPKPVVVLKVDDFAGVWTVRHDGIEEKGWRMDLKKNGKFRFSMKGMTSEGEWTVVDNEIVLVYKKVDGEPLEDGASGLKRLPVAIDASTFKIDTYRYERATGD